MTLHSVLADGGTLVCLITSAIGIYKFRALSKDIRPIFYFVLLGAFTELFTDFYRIFIAQKTIPIAHFYYTTSILILIVFYRRVLAGYIKTWIIDIVMIVYFCYAVINLIFIQSIFDFPSLLGAIGALLLIIFSSSLFTRIMSEAKILGLRKEPTVWINVSLLFYYAGSFFYFIMFNLNVENAYEFARKVGVYIVILNIVFYAIIGYSFFLVKKHENRI